jgi:hypothetical protein
LEKNEANWRVEADPCNPSEMSLKQDWVSLQKARQEKEKLKDFLPRSLP